MMCYFRHLCSYTCLICLTICLCDGVASDHIPDNIFNEFDQNNDSKLNKNELRRIFSNHSDRSKSVCSKTLSFIENMTDETLTQPEINLQCQYSFHKEEKKKNTKLTWHAWVMSTVAVIVISAVGLIVVWLIPLMPQSLYNMASQFLIAMAVGSLTGDALLHLIPHALVSHSEEEHEHGDEDHGSDHIKLVAKCVLGLIGIHLFFITERLTILCQNFKSKRKEKLKSLTEDNNINAAANQLDITTSFHRNQHSHHHKLHWAKKSCNSLGPSEPDQCMKESVISLGEQLCNMPKNHLSTNTDCPDALDMGYCLKQTQMNNNAEDGVVEDQVFIENGQPHSVDVKMEEKALVLKSDEAEMHELAFNSHQSPAVPASAHPYQNKPHGHHHGHSHDLSSVKAIAYTVIAGDGLHNFCDGIAIGAAFAKSTYGGLSTSIAILFHELPHELGDFAVLLRAGMSIRTAIFYNLLSSIFCAVGMVIGVAIGQIPEAINWVFMLTAGMFLYIALVDMMPELSTSRLRGSRRCHSPSMLFLWQNLGMILGSIVMLIIAVFEHRMVE